MVATVIENRRSNACNYYSSSFHWQISKVILCNKNRSSESPRRHRLRRRRQGAAGTTGMTAKSIVVTFFEFMIATMTMMIHNDNLFSFAFSVHPVLVNPVQQHQQQLLFRDNMFLLRLNVMNENNDDGDWTTMSNGIDSNNINNDDEEDCQKVLLQKQDGTYWSSFEPSADTDLPTTNETATTTTTTDSDTNDDEMMAEMWIDQIQSLASMEVEFNIQEADRADKVRQMEEYGFDRTMIQNALGVAMDTTLETIDEMVGMQSYREESFWDTVDLTTVESHTRVEKDDETLEPSRIQMVYVDEHTCIGCTNCAMIAQSTFFMHPEHGRARVFQQWGDTDETIQIAIETCPVDCIHYIPYDELVSLEIDRRDQNINSKARLVSQAENGNSLSHLSGRGSNAFTAPQLISGNMKARCNNCPTRGCKTCPMFGVGKNPVYEAAEQLRKEKKMKRQVQQQRERDEKYIEL